MFHPKNRRTFTLFTRSEGRADDGKLTESSDKSNPIVGFLAQSSDRRITICFRSGLSRIATFHLPCRFLWKNSLIFRNTLSHGNRVEDSATKILAESSTLGLPTLKF